MCTLATTLCLCEKYLVANVVSWLTGSCGGQCTSGWLCLLASSYGIAAISNYQLQLVHGPVTHLTVIVHLHSTIVQSFNDSAIMATTVNSASHVCW